MFLRWPWGISIPDTSEKEGQHMGVTAHKEKGTHGWEAPRDYSRHIHREPGRIINKSQTNLRDAGKHVKAHKGAHQEKDGLGGSGLM